MNYKSHSMDYPKKRLIIGDSLVSHIGECGDTTIVSLRGGKVENFLIYIINNFDFISSFECIILHFGTNNLSEKVSNMNYFVEHYKLILMILCMSKIKCILLSSVIPRLDHINRDVVVEANKQLKDLVAEINKICKGKLYFIPTSRLFTHYSFGKVTGLKENLFWEDKLHFSHKGNGILRNYFIQKFNYHGYPICKTNIPKPLIYRREFWEKKQKFLKFDRKIFAGFQVLNFIDSMPRSIAGVSVICYEPNFISSDDSLLLFDDLCKCVNFSRKKNEPRETAWYADVDYYYSGIVQKGNPNWPHPLKDLRSQLEQYLCTSFNSVLCNYYSDGKSSIAAHADDEEQLSRYPIIASISLKQKRTFNIREKGKGKTLKLDLVSGSLLVMMGATQLQYLHSMKKSRVKDLDPRINLTFRYTYEKK